MADTSPNFLSLGPRIGDFEEGRLDEDEVIDLFRDLIRTGTVWHLQGSYVKLALDFINSGLFEELS